MKKTIILMIVSILLFSFVSVFASEFSGDGTHDVKKGDTIILDNGWKIVIKTVGIGDISELVGFDYYDNNANLIKPSNIHSPSGDTSSAQVQKIEGRKKFGTDTILKVEIEVLDVSGQELARAGASWVEKENARINIISIDEALPRVVGGDEEIEEVDKELTYKNGRAVSLKLGEKITLGNGYKLKLDRFNPRPDSNNPVFSVIDSEDNLIDDSIGIGKDFGRSLGSIVYVESYDEEQVSLKIIDGSRIDFGTGWNLFSISLEDGDGYGTVLEITCNKAPLWIWNNEIKDYVKIGILEEGAKIPANKGIWAKIQTKRNVHADKDCEIIVSGKKSVSTKGRQLKAGWNLIGAPISSYGQIEVFDGGSNFNLVSFNDILGDCRIEKGPWQFLATIYTHDTIASDVAEKNKFSQPFRNELRLNRGYFIKVIDDCMLEDI